jgi:excisionase family DNA binding protein
MNLPEILTVAEVAVRLHCSKGHVCNAIAGKVKGVSRLPAINMGRRKLIRVSALELWLTQNEPGGTGQSAQENAMIPSCGSDAVGASKGN